MALSLAKNQTISLDKEVSAGLQQVRMGLGWDPVKASGFFGRLLSNGGSIDLDASCLVMAADKSVLDVVWFRQLKSKDKQIIHSGDNLTGEGGGDDEVINVNLAGLSDQVAYLVFTVNSFRGQSFDEVENAYCRLLDDQSGEELVRFNLAEKGSHTGVIMAYLSRTSSGWDMTAVGQATRGRTAQDLAGEAAGVIR